MRYIGKWINFAAVIAILVLVSGCSAGGGTGGSYNSPKTSQNNKASSLTEEELSEEEAAAEEQRRLKEEELVGDTYMVEDLSLREERIILKSLSSGRRYRFAFGLTTRFLDKWGNRTSQTDFVPGSIVKIGSAANNVLSSISLSKDAWIIEDLTNFSYDRDREIFMVGNSKYRIRPTVGVFSGDLSVTMDDVTKEDHLRVSGIDREVLSVSVTTGHGYIALINTDFFKDSMISIGSDIYTTITKDTVIPVSAGKYRVTVAKDGYGGSTSVKVSRNDTVTIDLNTLKGDGPKQCRLIFKTSIGGVKVKLDGKRIPVNRRISVDYGNHRLKVSIPDYEKWEKTLLVNSPRSAITLDPADYNKEKSAKDNSAKDNSGGNNNASAPSNISNNSNGNSSSRSSDRSNTDYTDDDYSYSRSSGSRSRDSDDDYDDYDRYSNSDNPARSRERSSTYRGNSYGRAADDLDEDDDINTRSTTRGNTSDSADSATDRARQAELDYLDTLSNMITQLTGED